MNRFLLLVLLTVASVTLPACGGDDGDGSKGPPPQTCEVSELTQGAETNIKEVEVRFRVSGCTVLSAALSRAVGFADPATPMGDGVFRRFVVLKNGDNVFDVIVRNAGGEQVAGQVSFAYNPAAPVAGPDSGFVHGRVLDATDETPIAGAVIYARGVPGEVTSGADGTFQFPTPGAGRFLFTIEAEDHTLAQRSAVVARQGHVALEDALLVKKDSITARVTPGAGGELLNGAGDVHLRIPAGAVRAEVDVAAVSFPRAQALPSALPDSSRWTQAIELFPDGLKLDKPVPVRVRNELGFAPGTPVPVGYYNRDLGNWEPMGMGTVTEDGEWIETLIEHFSSIDKNFPIREQDRPAPGKGRRRPCSQGRSGSSLVDDLTGQLSLFVPVASRVEHGHNESLRLLYDSATVSGMIYAVIPFDAGVDNLQQLEVSLTLEGNRETLRTAATPGESRYLVGLRMAPQNAAGDPLAPGVYPLATDFKALAPSTYMTTDTFGGAGVEDTGVETREPVPFENRQLVPVSYFDARQSPFGAGWRLEGAEEIIDESDLGLVVWRRPREAQLFTMGSFSESLFSSEDAFFEDLVDFFPLTDGRVLLVGQEEIRVASSVTALADATLLATLEEDAWQATLGRDGLIIAGITGNLYQVSLTGTVTGPIELQPLVQALGTEQDEFFYASARTLAVDRDGTVYMPLVGYGLLAVHNLTGQPTVEAIRLTRFPERDTEVVSLAYSESEHALYMLLDVLSLVQRYDLAARNESTHFSGALALEGTSFSFFDRLSVDDENGDVYYHSFWGDVTRIRRGGAVDRLESQLHSHLVTDGCMVLISRFPVGQTPIGFCRAGNGPAQFLALTPERGFNSETGDYLTRTETGYVISGRSRERRFDTAGRLVARQTVQGEEQLQYTDGLLTSITHADGTATTFSYAGGKLTGITTPAGTSNVQVDGSGDLVSLTDPDGVVSTFSYEDHRLVERSVDDRTLAYGWNEHGSVSTATLATGEVRHYESHLDALNTVGIAPASLARASFTDGEGGTVSTAIGIAGEPTACRIGPEDWTITQSVYMGMRFTSAERGEESVSSGWAGDQMVYHARNGLPTYWAEIDEKGRITSVLDYFEKCDYWYDEERISGVSCGDRVYLDYVYTDADNLPDEIDDHVGSSPWLLTYDEHGNLQTQTDPLGGVTGYERNPAGFVTAITNAEEQTTSFTWNAAGDLLSITNPESETTSFTYAAVPTCEGCIEGRRSVLASITDGLDHTWSLTVRDDGRIASVSNPLGNTRTYSYDGRRLLEGIATEGSHQVSFAYDARRMLASTSIGSASTTYTHDDVGHLVSASGPRFNLTRTIDGSAVTEVITDASGGPSTTIDWDYQEMFGAMTEFSTSVGPSYTLFGATGPLFIGLEVDGVIRLMVDRDRSAAGGETSRILGDALGMPVVQMTMGHDDLRRLQTVSTSLGAGGTVSDSVTYAYEGSLGRIASMTSDNGSLYPTLSFTRDAAGRLTGVSGDVTATYAYDAAGRMVTSSRAGTLTYDAAGRLQSTGLASYTHEARGTRASRTQLVTANGLSAGEKWVYTFDDAERLTRVQKYASASAPSPYSTVDLAYDPLWRLASVSVDGAVTRYLWVGDVLLAEVDNSGALIRAYSPGADIDQVSMIHEGGNDYYVIDDHLGTIWAIVDGAGNVVARYQYDPYGVVLQATGAMAAQPRRLAGMLYLEPLRLYYMRARFYDPEVGQFISEDPEVYVRSVVHPYAYAANDPTRFSDHSGLVEGGWDGAKEAGSMAADQVWGQVRGEVFGPLDTGYSVYESLSGYNNDPVNNQRHGLNELLRLTGLDKSRRMREIFDSFHDFSKSALDLFDNGDKEGPDPCGGSR